MSAAPAQGAIFRDLTRATKFQKKFQLPPDFSDVLKDFTREVLRDQPTDIYAYGASYFKKVALEAEGLEEVPPPEGAIGRKQLSAEERQEMDSLQNKMIDAFAEEDYDKTAKLHSHVIKRVLGSAGMSPDQTLFLISNCGNNLHLLDGSIDYERFVTDNIIYIYFFMNTNHIFQQPSHDSTETVHGLVRDELVAQLTSLMQQDDDSATGRLLLEAYYQCLKRAPIQLTKRDITLLTAEAIVSGDNFISIAEEASRAFPLLQHSYIFEAFQTQWDEGKI
mmetsp:Transcript_79338/g.140013  ORF Transcript_79338/g.140013 Transcript_79338/m.140013 type:complete len:278 (-) Transcript_79338:518-1351(-)